MDNVEALIMKYERSIVEREKLMNDQTKTGKFRWHHEKMREMEIKMLESLRLQLNKKEH